MGELEKLIILEEIMKKLTEIIYIICDMLDEIRPINSKSSLSYTKTLLNM